MKAKYVVHSVGPVEEPVEMERQGVKARGVLNGHAVELVSADGHGTVKLVTFDKAPFAVGDTVEATFEKVG